MTMFNPRGLYRAAHRVLTPVSAAYRSREFNRAVDATDDLSRNSCLVLAPHPDDETLGCAATIMRKRATGTPVTIAIVTDGEVSMDENPAKKSMWSARRRDEALQAAAVMDVDSNNVRFLGFQDLSLSDEMALVELQLLELVRDVSPQEIFVPAIGDRHPDHFALNLALRSIVKRQAYGGTVYEYPIWLWRVYPWTTRPANIIDAIWAFARDPIAALFRPAAVLVSTEGFIERKRAAIACYESQVSNPSREDRMWTFPDGFAESFLGPYEIFFRLRAS